MAVYAPTNDFQFIKSQNPYAAINLYRPGTTLSATDIALGGAGAEAGILDENLGGAKRLAGLDRTKTANEYYKYLANQTPVAATPQKPANSIQELIAGDPEMMAVYNQAKQAAQLGSRNAMETLNERGILNSSITGDTVTGLEQQAMTNILPQLFAFQEQKKQQARQDAYSRMIMLGYADNEVSKVLGIPVGTPSADFSMQEAQLFGTLNGKQTLAAQGQAFNQNLATQQFDYQKQWDQWTREYQQKGFDFDTSYKLAQLDLQRQELLSNTAYRRDSLALDQQRLTQDDNSLKMNDLIQKLNTLYTVKNPITGEVTVNPETIDQLEYAIRSQSLSDQAINQLLGYYGITQ